MPSPGVVWFSVRWSTGVRVFQLVMAFALIVIAAGVGYLTFGPMQGDETADAVTIWGFRGFALFFAVCAVGLVGEARSAIWLDGHRLLRQGPLWRVAVDLRTATFAMTVVSWRYTDRLLPVSVKTPALVVQASRFRRIKLPMVCRFAERGSDGRFAVRWLPDNERNAIADAIEAYATVAGKEKVAHFLRHVDRSPVQPSVDLG